MPVNLRKIPWRMSSPQKYRHRQRLRRVDRVVETVRSALLQHAGGTTIPAIERWRAEMPTEAEMEPRDKYTVFDRKARGYRKGLHSTSLPLSLCPLLPLTYRSHACRADWATEVPKWTRVSQRVNPPGF